MNVLREQLDLTLFHVERASYRRLELRDNTHPHWAISYVVAGDTETVSRGHRGRVRAGDVMIHPPRVAYSELAERPGTHEWFLFEAVIPPGVDLLRQFLVPPILTLGERDSSGYREAFDALLRVWQGGGTGRGTFAGMEAAGLLARILALILSAWERGGSAERPAALQTGEDRMAPVLNYMADNLNRKISRDELARIACLHPASLDRRFRELYAAPPLALLRRMRLDRARTLLESGDATLETVAAECGFVSASHMGRAFRARFGQSPGQWRQGLTDARNRYRDAL